MTSNHSRSASSVNKGVTPGFLFDSFRSGNLAQSFARRFFSPQKGHFRGYLDAERFLSIDLILNILLLLWFLMVEMALEAVVVESTSL